MFNQPQLQNQLHRESISPGIAEDSWKQGAIGVMSTPTTWAFGQGTQRNAGARSCETGTSIDIPRQCLSVNCRRQKPTEASL